MSENRCAYCGSVLTGDKREHQDYGCCATTPERRIENWRARAEAAEAEVKELLPMVQLATIQRLQLAELEAQAGAMRAALVKAIVMVDKGDLAWMSANGVTIDRAGLLLEIDAALAPDAGRATAERMRRLEEVSEAAQSLATHIPDSIIDEMHLVWGNTNTALWLSLAAALRAALAAVDAKVANPQPLEGQP